MRLALLLASSVLAFPSLAAADESLWTLLRDGGHVIVMRHAVTTPGVGDPAGWPPLGDLFDNRAREAEQLRALRAMAGRRPTGGNLLLVTHGSVILPLTGIQPAPAELVVLTPDGAEHFRVAGRLTP